MKKLAKKLNLLLGCMLCSMFLSAADSTTALAAEQTAPGLVSIYGTVRKDNGRIFLTDIHGDTELDELVLNISDATRILDAVNGFPVSADNLRDGEVVYAYISPAMALSLPPQSHAEMIICSIPADFAVPAYETAEALSVGENGAAVVSTARGNVYYIDTATVLLPYLTRNMVTAGDLTKGRNFLVWKTPIGQTGENAAAKIVMFQ